MDRRRGRKAPVPRPDQVRTLQGTPFGWLDARLHRRGWLRVLSSEDLAVYAFLCLVANRQGVSYYRRDRIGLELGLSDPQVYQALRRLQALDLVAYTPFHLHAADGYHQVLAIPAGPPPAATVGTVDLRALGGRG